MHLRRDGTAATADPEAEAEVDAAAGGVSAHSQCLLSFSLNASCSASVRSHGGVHPSVSVDGRISDAYKASSLCWTSAEPGPTRQQKQT